MNVYQVSEISDIKITDPPMWGTRGSATIRLAGDHTPAPSRTTAVKDQDSILLASKNDADAMRELLAHIRSLQAQSGVKPNESLMMGVVGADGNVLLFNNRVVLCHKGVLSKINRRSDGTSEIRIPDITGIQLKRPGTTKGYIQFSAPGHTNLQQGIWGAVQDELSITIANNQQFDQFLLLKLKIDDLRDGSVNPAVVASTPSTFSYVADELEKLNSLQEKGILSQQEFEQQKAKLLS